MKKLYFIQYEEDDAILETKITSLGRYYQVLDGWVVESTINAQAIYEILTQHKPLMSITIFGLDKTNFWGRYDKDLWNLFK